jgi:hypothetical protein
MTKLKKTQPTEAQLLDLLKKVLPKATRDPSLAGKIYDAVESELKATARVNAFEKFCQRVELPDLEAKTVMEVKKQFDAAFGDGNVTLIPDEKKAVLVVVAQLTSQDLRGEIIVKPVEDTEEQGIKLKFVPLPVCLPGDKELIWMLAKRENMTPEEAAIALAKLEDDFWGSKTGQKLLRDRVERSFPEFMERVSTGALGEMGLKRHYKTPEVLRELHVAKG